MLQRKNLVPYSEPSAFLRAGPAHPVCSSLRMSHQEAAWPLLKTGEHTAVAMVTQTQRACLNFCSALVITPAMLLNASLKIRMLLPSSAILASLDTVRFVLSP